MWLTGPVAPRHVGSSQTRARTRVPCIGRQILNHYTTREAQKFLILIKISLSIFFVACASGIASKMSSPYPRSFKFSPNLSFRSCIILRLTFKSVICFELIFVRSVRSVSTFLVLHVDSQLFHHHLLKRLSLLHCIVLLLPWR